MKRTELLNGLGYEIPALAKIRLFLDTDAKNEADDQYAIMHFLLTPMVDILGIGAAHFEKKAKTGHSMEDSYQEIEKLLGLAKIDDVKAYKGARMPLNEANVEENAASLKIIEEAKNGHLYVVCLGALTNVVSALVLDPSITSNLTIIFNGGGPYPLGRAEFNLMQDLKASRIIFESNVEIWQIPQDVYASLEVSLASLRENVYPAGEIGKYLFEELVECNLREFNPNFKLRAGENWTLGDNAAIGPILMNQYRDNFTIISSPAISDEGLYLKSSTSKKIRVYKSLDTNLILNDFYSKLRLIYKE